MSVTEHEKLLDICATKHGGNEQSREANRNSSSYRAAQRREVYELIRTSANGLSMKEVADLMGLPFNHVSGRGSELKQMKMVEKTGEVRKGSAVLRASDVPSIPLRTDVKEEAKSEVSVKPIPPGVLQKELAALAELFEKSDAKAFTGEMYDQAKARLYKGFEAWMNQSR